MVSFALASQTPGEALERARVRCGEWDVETDSQIGVRIGGVLAPRTEYTVTVEARGTSGASCEASGTFRTGRLGLPWVGTWITTLSYTFPRKQSPVPMRFRRSFRVRPGIRRAWIECTALGVYELDIDGRKVGEDYFAPGFTSYAHQLQYQTYDVTDLLSETSTLTATVAGGWAVGSFTYRRRTKISADRQAFLAELWIEYHDGSTEVIPTDETWQVSTDGPFRMAEWYDGETYDATFSEDDADWRPAQRTAPNGSPHVLAQYGPPVRAERVMHPVAVTTAASGETIYDFGQNFAGVIHARLRGRHGQTVVFRHAEVLVDGELFVESLRTAKATATYTCVDGDQEYSPRMTYMGFRYVGMRGADPEDVELTALVLHSQMREVGSFTCSDERLNRLNEAIRWGARSNFVDIPTDCPQRDERMGWTGDIAVFAPTAAFNFDTSRFLDKWLRDLAAEQGRGGGIPVVVPRGGDTFPMFATAGWGDACVLVPWAEYLARGDIGLLRRQYPTMLRYLRAALWWAGLFSVGWHRYIWSLPFHFGDWAAPTGGLRAWVRRGPWMATAFLSNSCRIVSHIADILGESEDSRRYARIADRVAEAYRRRFTDGRGRLRDEFQTGYVLPLHFGMTTLAEGQEMAENLARLIDENGGRLSTGFPGTPYILFALSDHGRLEDAYKLLQQTSAPSWLYMIESGGTTIWERWDALSPDGTVNTGDLSGVKDADPHDSMVSFNHYAAGSVGSWLYQRVAGLEPMTGGYERFRVRPLPGGGLTRASATVDTPYGIASASWCLRDEVLEVDVTVPVSTLCELELPDGTSDLLSSGTHHRSVAALGGSGPGASR